MSYAEEQWGHSLVEKTLRLEKDNIRLGERLREEARLREIAENKYHELCERCVSLYLTDRTITEDTFSVQVSVPRFMNQSDLEEGVVQHFVTIITAEREKCIFNQVNKADCKPKE